MTLSYSAVRDSLVDELIKDLVGPEKNNEELEEGPVSHYLTGILYPQESKVDPEEDKDSGDPADEDDEIDMGSLMAYTTNPSSIGLTFTVKKGEEISIDIHAAIYEMEYSSIGGSKKEIWSRKPLELAQIILSVIENQPGKVIPLHSTLELNYRIRIRKDVAVVTVSLVNRGKTPKNERIDKYCYFQPEIIVQSTQNGKAIFVPRTNADEFKTDPDRLMNSLLYRHSPEYSVGHGCATEWEALENQNATLIRTTIIPAYEILQLSPDQNSQNKSMEMKFLAQNDQKEIISKLKEFSQDYSKWINQLEIKNVPETYRNIATQNINNCIEIADRINSGITILENNESVFRAFQLANQAMLTQRARITWIKNNTDKKNTKPIENETHRWRAFQLAFFLLCIPGIVDPNHEDRNILDLLWFPTGGGKTEAYLGLTAFTIFLRRLRGSGKQEASGVTVLMRYTLRLLTIQQFQRASSLILACELLRRTEPLVLGHEPISLGLWVGGNATPNSLKQAKTALNELKTDGETKGGNPFQILHCPWCGEKLTPFNYIISTRMDIHCPNTQCEFKTGLPLFLIDDDIYGQRPSLLLGTVDKFARLPWVGESGQIFGRMNNKCLPPELIIQDELHLISGSLGTMVGLYETAVDILCEKDGIGPKIIASTATIRRASEQGRNLFNRGFSQFPPPGLDSRDNFFSRQISKDEKPGRIYIGIHAQSKSIKTTLLRTYAVLLQRISEIPIENSFKDPYWTTVAYFNSMRELGGALRLLEDDVRERMKLLSRRRGVKQRYLGGARELNSRCSSSEIPELLEILEKSMGQSDSLDVLLATNMISVGVDIDRLGLMVVNGQPKTTSEYIQATSRVGRKYPGLVITVYNWTRPRDRSHYERFRGYHSSIYSQVEPTSVTPFSNRARDRGLHGVFIALARHLISGLNPEDSAINFSSTSIDVERIIEKIMNRVETLDPDELDETRKELNLIVNRWAELINENDKLVYGENPYKDPIPPFLMLPIEKEYLADELVFPTLNSLRDVEGESQIFVKKGREKNA